MFFMEKLDMMEFPPLLPEEIIERAGRFGTANLCDGMSGLGIPGDGCMDAGINPVVSDMKIVATACTVDSSGGDNLPIHVALYTAQPGYVMVIDGKGHSGHPYFGGLMSSTGQAVGLKGMIIDGLVRDRADIRGNDFPVFCRGFLPRAPRKEKPGKINYPIMCGGISVCPGDLIVADCDGVCVVPRGRIDEVLEKAGKKVAYEAKRQEAIAEYRRRRLSGEPLNQLAPQWVVDMLGEKYTDFFEFT